MCKAFEDGTNTQGLKGIKFWADYTETDQIKYGKKESSNYSNVKLVARVHTSEGYGVL